MKKNHNIDAVLKGKAGEHYFIYEILKRGYNISSPVQEDTSYDFIVDNGKTMKRVQLKSSFNPKVDVVRNGKYISSYERHFFRLSKTDKTTYSKKEIDYIVCFLDTTKNFYILPIEIANKIKSLTINIHSKRKSKYDQYKNAWNLLLNTK